MTRIEREKMTVRQMIVLYCRKRHAASPPCDECRKLVEYAEKRLDSCRYGQRKSTCKKCTTHCYTSEYRNRIREVMRFSGPRMILYHPLFALKHFFNR